MIMIIIIIIIIIVIILIVLIIIIVMVTGKERRSFGHLYHQLAVAIELADILLDKKAVGITIEKAQKWMISQNCKIVKQFTRQQ